MIKIPEITQDKEAWLWNVVRAVGIDESKKFRFYNIEGKSSEFTAFTWSGFTDEEVPEIEPIPHGTILTYHTYCSPPLFKPTLREVYAQIQNLNLDNAVAFTIQPDKQEFTDCAGFHRANVQLWRLKKTKTEAPTPAPVAPAEPVVQEFDLLKHIAAIERAHFRTCHDTGANLNVLLVWNIVRSWAKLEPLHLSDLPAYCKTCDCYHVKPHNPTDAK